MEAEEQEIKNKKKMMVPLMVQRGGPSTPSPTWRLESNNKNPVQEFLRPTQTTVSGRKLCANLWELEPLLLHEVPVSNNNKNKNKSKILGRGEKRDFVHSPTTLVDQQARASTSKPQREPSPMQRRQSVERNSTSQQPLASAEHGSLHEMTPNNPSHNPTRFSDFKIRKDEQLDPSYSNKTSKELLRVLNKIWSLEEEQEYNVSLLKGLKLELDNSRSQIKDLLKKNKEQSRIKAAIESMREELDNKRQFSREILDLKSSFTNTLKEVKRERKARVLLEKLCDGFAKGIQQYEQEVRSLRHQADIDPPSVESADHLVLHMSEAWLDERMQMEPSDDNTIVDKLGHDIQAFLQAIESKKERRLSADFANDCSWRRESFPLNDIASAPRDAVDEEGYSGNNTSECFELNNSESKKHLDEIKRVEIGRSSSNQEIVDLNQNQSLSSEGDKIHPESVLTAKLSESSATLPEGLKDNTLKAKLLEARLESRKYRFKNQEFNS